MSSIRYSILDDRHVLIAPERMRKPDVLNSIVCDAPCPFCEGNEAMTPKEIHALRENEPNMEGWKIRVVPNLYKALQIETPNEHHKVGIFEEFGGFGAHEIIIDTPEHKTKMSELRLHEYIHLFSTIKARANDLQNDKRLIYLSIFKNVGKSAGASLAHLHTQIIGMPFMPTSKANLFKRKFEFYQQKGRKLLRDIVDEEIRNEERILLQNDDFVAYLPFASSFPFEIIIASRKDVASVCMLDESAIYNLGLISERVINALYKSLGEIAFNLSFITPPINANFQNDGYFYDIKKISLFALRIQPRIYGLAGFEVSEGMNINPISPEFAAKVLKDAL